MTKQHEKSLRRIGLEEHVFPSTAQKAALFLPEDVCRKMIPSVEQRISDMDEAGISMQVLSMPLTTPKSDWTSNNPLAPVIPLDESAVPFVQGMNEELYQIVSSHPDRFSAFAALPMSVPEEAAAELERAVTSLGFVGAMIPGTIGEAFLDDPKFTPVLETAARLNVPIYIHPGTPPKRVIDVYYTGSFSPAVSEAIAYAAYGWHYEVSLQVTRLIVSGVFDRIPDLKIITGHLGEGLAFHMGRLDRTLNPIAGLKKPVSQYLSENLWYTTSSYFDDEQFQLARAMFGEDHLLFSVDYPFEDPHEAVTWFDRLSLPIAVREKIAHGNAEQLLNLPVK